MLQLLKCSISAENTSYKCISIYQKKSNFSQRTHILSFIMTSLCTKLHNNTATSLTIDHLLWQRQWKRSPKNVNNLLLLSAMSLDQRLNCSCCQETYKCTHHLVPWIKTSWVLRQNNRNTEVSSGSEQLSLLAKILAFYKDTTRRLLLPRSL